MTDNRKERTSPMSCRDISALVSESLDRPLSLSERLVLRTHLLFCRACNEYSRQIRLIEDFFRRTRTETDSLKERDHEEPVLPEESRRRITRRIEDEIRDHGPESHP